MFSQPPDSDPVTITVGLGPHTGIPIIPSDHVPEGSAFLVSFDGERLHFEEIQPRPEGSAFLVSFDGERLHFEEIQPQIEVATAGPPGDILEQIDAAVEERCACGCGRPLHPAGPSGYFASQDCQARWHAAQATAPADVYDRDDAAVVYVGADEAPVPLVGVDEPTPDTLAPSHDNVHGTAYRVECPHCMRGVSYQPHIDEDDGCDRPSDECRVYVPPRTCPRCSVVLPNPTYIAAVHDHGPILLFELFDGTSRTHRRMPARRLHRAPDRRHLVDLTWEIMRRDVDRFTRSWLGTRPSERIAFPVVSPATARRLTGPA